MTDPDPARATIEFRGVSKQYGTGSGQPVTAAGNVSLTADSLVRAVRTYASLTENGDWVEPATTHIVAAAPPAPQAPSALSPATSAVVVDAPPPLSPALSASVSGPSTSDFGLQTQPAAPQTRDSNRECLAIRNRPKVLKNK